MDLIRRAALDAAHEAVDGGGDRNARFAMRVGAIVADGGAYHEFASWIVRVVDLPIEEFCCEADDVFGDVISKLVDLPMVVGLAWFQDEESFWRYRTIVHRFRAWQLTRRVEIDPHHIPSKVHRMIEVNADFVPSAVALCVYYPPTSERVAKMTSLSKKIVEALDPVLSMAGDDRVDRINRIMYSDVIELMHTSSKTSADAIAQVLRTMTDLMAGADGEFVAHSVRRFQSLRRTELGGDELGLRLLFVSHTADEQRALVAQVDDAYTLARACIAMPNNTSVDILTCLFDRLSEEETLLCASAINACDMRAIDDARLLALANASHLSNVDSAWVSVLNATTTPHTTGRWLDALGHALTRDETAQFEKHGDGAAVVRCKDVATSAQRRLMLLVDVCKLLEGAPEGYDLSLVATFYTEGKIPVNYARKVETQPTTELSSKERNAHFAHECHEQLRMCNRQVHIPSETVNLRDGLPIDEKTMSALEVALRNVANASFKEQVDLDALESDTIEYEAVDQAIELVQHDDTHLSINDVHPLDAESHSVLREIALMKRRFPREFKTRDWPYKAVTGCRMCLVRWPRLVPIDPSPLDEDLKTLLM